MGIDSGFFRGRGGGVVLVLGFLVFCLFVYSKEAERRGSIRGREKVPRPG